MNKNGTEVTSSNVLTAISRKNLNLMVLFIQEIIYVKYVNQGGGRV